MAWLHCIVSAAIQNVVRQRRRAAAGAVAVTFGVVAFILAGGFIEWVYWAMREGTIKANIGHIQVTRVGYFKSGMADPFGYLIAEKQPELEQVEKAKHVRIVSPRISFSGLISVGETTASYIADGVDAEREKIISSDLMIMEGQGLDPSDPNGIVIGQGLAKTIGAQVGAKVVLMANTRTGGVNAIEVTIRGTFTTATKAYDDTALRLPIKQAQRLLRTTGAHRWVLLLDQTSNTDQAVAELRKMLPAKTFEVVPWIELADFYTKTVTLFSKQVALMQFIIAAIIVLSITNTMMMNVMERTGEIGTNMALGMNRRGVLLGFVIEGVLLGTIGGVIGLVLGLALAYVISKIGIPMPPPPGLSRAFIGEVRVTSQLAVEAVVLAFVTTLLASIYPAWKASQLVIVDALRRNR